MDPDRKHEIERMTVFPLYDDQHQLCGNQLTFYNKDKERGIDGLKVINLENTEDE